MPDDNNNEAPGSYYRARRLDDPTTLTLQAISSARRETEKLFDLKLENLREDIRRLTRQIDNIEAKIDVLRERVNEIARRNWSVVGAYIVGAFGVAALIVAAIFHASH